MGRWSCQSQTIVSYAWEGDVEEQIEDIKRDELICMETWDKEDFVIKKLTKIVAVVQKFKNKKKSFTWDTKIVVLETAAPKIFIER